MAVLPGMAEDEQSLMPSGALPIDAGQISHPDDAEGAITPACSVMDTSPPADQAVAIERAPGFTTSGGLGVASKGPAAGAAVHACPTHTSPPCQKRLTRQRLRDAIGKWATIMVRQRAHWDRRVEHGTARVGRRSGASALIRVTRPSCRRRVHQVSIVDCDQGGRRPPALREHA